MSRVEIDPLADLQLLQIWLDIAQHNEAAADTYIREIVNRTWSHADFPHSGQQEEVLAGMTGFSPDLVRSFLYRNHRCYYYVRAADVIYVVACLDMRRELEPLIAELSTLAARWPEDGAG